MNDPTSAELLQRLEHRDDAAATELFDRYAQRLVALARKRISPALARRIDADDVVQSAYRSFFLHAREGEFAWKRSGDLWRLLVTITLHKLHRQAARHTAQRRAIGREVQSHDSDTWDRLEAIDPEPQPVEVIALLEQIGVVMRLLSEDQRRVIQLRLQGESDVEIGKALACSPRTVRRLLQQTRERLMQSLLEATSLVDASQRPPEVVEFDLRSPLDYHDFLLEDHLGSGGMGKVYRAIQRSLGRPVAIKSLRKARLQDRHAVTRFVQEATMLARLEHENIVSCHGIGRFPGGGYFLALDLIEGDSLATRLKAGLPSLDEAIRIIGDVASAIAYSHHQGVLHGDLTPSNVLLDQSGHVFVTDFGFSQLLPTASDSETVATAIGGTQGYLAPEQQMAAAQLDERTDIFGIGAVLYAMLTGRAPIAPSSTPSPELYAKIAEPSTHNAHVTAAIDRICMKALAFEAEDRFATVDELLAAIRDNTTH